MSGNKRLKLSPNGAACAALLAGLTPYRITEIEAGCKRVLEDGRHGCVLVFGPFQAPGDAILLYMISDRHARGLYLRIAGGTVAGTHDVALPGRAQAPGLGAAELRRALDGDFAIRPTGVNALWFGDLGVAPGN